MLQPVSVYKVHAWLVTI